MLVHYPIALWTTSLIADLIFYFNRNTTMLQISKFLIIAGIIGAILAAIPGIIDWWALTDPVVTKTANWHARLNIAALIIFGASFYLRLRHYGAPLVGFNIKIPFVVSVAGFVLMTISAKLGGKLVYEHRIGVKEADG